MKTSKTLRYILYLLSITGVFSISMLIITMILLGFNSFMFLLGVPLGIVLVIQVKPLLGYLFLGEEDTIHTNNDKIDKGIEIILYIITMVCLRYVTEKGDMSKYVLGESLELTWLFTKFFLIGVLVIEGIRFLFHYFKKGHLLEVKEQVLIED